MTGATASRTPSRDPLNGLPAMSFGSLCRPALRLLLLLALFALRPAEAQQPLDTNLLANPDFEGGVGGWTSTTGTVGVAAYGSAVAPSLGIASEMSGGAQFARCAHGVYPGGGNWGFALAKQSIDVAGNASDIDSGRMYVRIGGHFGGAAGTGAYGLIRAVYYNGTGGVLSVPFVDPTAPGIGQTSRNNESTLMWTVGTYPMPPGTRTLEVQLLMYNGYGGGGGGESWCDNLDARLLLNPTTPAEPLESELLARGDFETRSFIDPARARRWIVTRGNVGFARYGASVAPSLAVGSSIAGGTQFLRCAYGVYPGGGAWGYCLAEQSIDVSGNATDIDAGILYLSLAGCFGGASSTDAYGLFRAYFYNESGGALSVPFVDPTLPGIGRGTRNGESTLLRVHGTYPIPVGTRHLKVELLLYNGYGNNGGGESWADNLSAKLTRNPSPGTPQIGANLIDNGGFELGTSVLNPPAATGWRVTRGSFQAQPYGLPGLPVPAVSTSIGGGAFLARATSDSNGRASMTQTFDLGGHGTAIDLSTLSVQLEGYLGGPAGDADNATLVAYYYSQYGALLGQDAVGPVTQAERGNLATLLFRRGTFVLPIGTRSMVLEANFYRNGSSNDAFVDNVRALLVPSGIALRYPGTGDDFDLRTGVNALPSGGPGRDLKDVFARDIVSIELRSPRGLFHWSPLLVAGNVFPTGTGVPSLGVPALHVNPAAPYFFWLLDGTTPLGPFGPSIVIPGGNELRFVAPAGLQGLSFLVQGITFGPLAQNGAYATTDAHELRFR